MRLPFLSVFVGLSVVVGCADDPKRVAGADNELVEDVAQMTRRPDGFFDVRCRDGRTEIVSAEQLRSDQVCNGGAPPAPSALSIRYACDGSSTLSLRVLNADGSETDERVAFSFASECKNAAETVARTRSTITRPTFIAVCNQRAELERFAASPAVGLRRVSNTPFSFASECARAAERTNATVDAIEGDVARIDYTCRGSTLEIRVIGRDATEGKAEIPFSFASECDRTAETMRPIRSDIRTTSAFGICDASADLRRFSVTPAGRLRELGKTEFSFASECNTAMAEANR